MKILSRFALVAAFVGSSSVMNAAVLDTNWSTFSFGLAVSQADTSYTFTLTENTFLRVVDCCVIGDEFRLTVNDGGGPVDYLTSATAPGDDGVSAGDFDGDSAWADARLSRAEVLLGAGNYTLDIYVTRNAAGTESGGAYAQLSAVPEPSTYLLLLTACGALVPVLRRKRV